MEQKEFSSKEGGGAAAGFCDVIQQVNSNQVMGRESSLLNFNISYYSVVAIQEQIKGILSPCWTINNLGKHVLLDEIQKRLRQIRAARGHV